MQELNTLSSEHSRKHIFRLKPDERYPDSFIPTIEDTPKTTEKRQFPSLSSKQILRNLIKTAPLPEATRKWCKGYNKRQQELEENTYQLREFKDLKKIRNQLFEEEKSEVMPFLARLNITNNEDDELAEANDDISSESETIPSLPQTLFSENDSGFKVSTPKAVEKDDSINTNSYKRSGRAVRHVKGNGIVANICGIVLRGRDIRTLYADERLNDQIINAYMSLIVERNKCDETLPKVHCTHSFFYEQLKLGRFRVAWTKQINIFELDLLIVPLFVAGRHWALATVDMHRRVIEYYDSMGLPHSTIISPLRRFLILHQRYEGRQVKSFIPCRIRVPRQENTTDCGVFVCQYAELLARRSPLRITQMEVQELRQKMMQEILLQQLFT